MKMMKIKLPPLVESFTGILRSELGPEVLPRSVQLLGVSLGIFVLAQFAGKLVTHTPVGAAAIGLCAGALLVAVTVLGSKLLGHSDRLTQILTALAAAGAAVTFVKLFLRLVLEMGFASEDLELPVDDLANFLLFPVFLWNVVVYASIFRRGFSVGRIAGFGLSLGYLLVLFFWIPHFFK
jgi:hypothetical protein